MPVDANFDFSKILMSLQQTGTETTNKDIFSVNMDGTLNVAVFA